MRRLVVPAMLLLALVLGLKAQETGSLPAFEVASVKPNKTGDGGMSISSPPGRFTASNTSLLMLILNAYSTPQSLVRQSQVVGAPSWLVSDRFDIAAKVPDGAPTNQTSSMLRALLAERFKLVTHFETRDGPIYALVMARGDGRLGPQLTRTPTLDCEAILAERQAVRARALASGTAPTPAVPGERPTCTTRVSGGPGPAGRVMMTFSQRNATMATLAVLLGPNAERNVIDRTGLTGQFNVELRHSPERGLPAAPDAPSVSPDDPPSLFTALQEQLGLKLESARGPIEFLIIDRVERPTED